MKKITILLFTAAAMAAGCKKFTNINQNPNSPTSVTPNVVLSAALGASANAIGTDFFNTNEWMGYWSRSGNYIAVQATEQYAITTAYEDGDFQDLYSTLSKYNYIEKTALASPSTLAFYAGVAKTMKALHFSNLVDGFGNVPYTQAFQVLKYPTPAYDDAQAIYNNLIIQLDSAVYYFNAATTYYKTATSTVISTDDKYDIMYGRGNSVPPAVRMAEWTAFANTVKLKLLMNESQAVTPGYISGEIAKINANGAGYITAGSSASVNPGYGSATQAQVNPFFGAFYTNAGSPTTTNNFYRANNYALNFYNGAYADGTNNPTGNQDQTRQYYVYTYFASGAIVGNYDGDPNSVSNSSTSGIGNFSDGDGLTKTYSQDQLILSDFESYFIQAEAAARGYLPVATAPALLQKAIEQNYVYLGDNTDDADAYVASGANDPNTNIAAAEDPANVAKQPSGKVDPTPGLQAIMTQKWIALNGINWFQAYTDYRRTQFPLSTVLGISHANAHVKNAIPYRYLYPLSEFSTNGKNVPNLANAQYTPIFWDKFEK